MKRPIITHMHKGSVLIVSMLILMVMTLIGITAMGTSTLEEKMAGNGRDQELAFQASEAALRDAETFLDGIVSTGGFNNTGGLYAIGTTPDINLATTWNTANSRAYSGTLSGTTAQPRYIIELESVVGGPASIDAASHYGEQGNPPVTVFRVTVRSTGGSGSATVMLQTYYGVRI